MIVNQNRYYEPVYKPVMQYVNPGNCFICGPGSCFFLPLIMNSVNKVKRILKDIAAALDVYAAQEAGPSLMCGRSGIALFYAYYYRLTGDEKYLEALGVQITESIDSLAEGHPGYSYCTGIAGIAWTLQHLVRIGIAEASDFEVLLAECDIALETYMDTALGENAYDFLHEGLGAVVYFIERMPHEKAAAQLHKAVRYLEKAADHDAGKTRWRDLFTTKEREYQQEVCYNLGLAHGTPAIITILGLLYEEGILPAVTGRLIEEGVQWLLATRYEEENIVHALYPTAVDKDNRPLYHNGSRLGWCYGDLCIAHTLLHAGIKLNKEMYKAEACAIFEHVLRFRDKENGSIADACFCHGSSGIAQMYRSAYLSSGLELLLTGAELWTDETMRMNFWPDGVAGFKYHIHNADEQSFHLLDGVAGIGLSLIAAIGGTAASGWDRCFLLS